MGKVYFGHLKPKHNRKNNLNNNADIINIGRILNCN